MTGSNTNSKVRTILIKARNLKRLITNSKQNKKKEIRIFLMTLKTMQQEKSNSKQTKPRKPLKMVNPRQVLTENRLINI